MSAAQGPGWEVNFGKSHVNPLEIKGERLADEK
jgi:hypothetical protein